MRVSLDLSVTPSRYLFNACQAVHLLALVALPFSALEISMQSLLAAAILAALWHYRRQIQYLSEHGALHLRLGRDGDWELALDGVSFQAARLLMPVFVHPLLTVLRFRLGDGRRCNALLLPDCVDRDDFRRLRVWLRHGMAGLR